MNSEDQIAPRRLRMIVMAMFVSGIPVAILLYSQLFYHSGTYPINRSTVLVGTFIWLLWLWRLLWEKMPRSFRVILWTITLIWNVQFIRLFPLAIFYPMPLLLMLHCMLIVAFSVGLIRFDRPILEGKSE